MKKLLAIVVIFASILFFPPIPSIQANTQSSKQLLHPIDNQVASVKAQGGAWEAFELSLIHI